MSFIHGSKLAWSLSLLMIVICLVVFFSTGANQQALVMLLRVSAKFSLTVFIVAFSAAGLHFFLQTSASAWVLQNRRYLGLSFASIFGLHFIGILCRMAFYPEQFSLPLPNLLVGGFSLVLAMTMAVTSNDAAVARLGARKWKRLHIFGAYYIWLLFLAAYVGNANENPATLPYLLFVLLALVLRLNKRFGGIQLRRSVTV